MTWATDELSYSELASEGGEFGIAITVAIAESGDDVFSTSLQVVPHAIAIAVTLAELGDDTFAAAVTQPQGSDLGEPLTLAEAKRAARIDDVITEFDDLVARSVTAARLMAEQETGREFVRKTRRFTFADWPSISHVITMYEPVDVAISWWDGAAWQALDVADYAWWESGTGTSVGPAIGKSWPTLGAVAGGPRVRIDVTAGPADPRSSTPADVKLYIAALVAHWHDKPSAVTDGNATPTPYTARLLDAARVYH